VRSAVQDNRNDHKASEKACDLSGRRACLVCGRPGTDGPVILGRRLCTGCERAIVSLDVGARDYDFFVARIREAWRSYIQERE